MLILVLCALLQGTNGFRNPLENPHLFEGDILIEHQNAKGRSEVLTDDVLQRNGDNTFKTASRPGRSLNWDRLKDQKFQRSFLNKMNAEDRSEDYFTDDMLQQNRESLFKSASQSDRLWNPLENPHLFEGDILLKNPDAKDGNEFPVDELQRNGDNTFKGASRLGRSLTAKRFKDLQYQRDLFKKMNAEDRSEASSDELLQRNMDVPVTNAPRPGRLGRSWNLLENPYLFRGDILLDDDSEARSAVPSDKRLWPGGVIPYEIDPALDENKTLIMEAMDHIMSKTCIKFVPWDGKEKSYLYLFPEDGCYSSWGRIGRKQYISLGEGCAHLGTILHELMHAIGFDHEQNRPDRDEYLKIYWSNIWPDALAQFDILPSNRTRLLNGFDFDSIMLYGPNTFSKDSSFRTMKSKVKGVYFTDPHIKTALSASDIYRVNTLYKCNGET